MSENGVFAVARSIWADPDFADEQFTEREAWMWLIGAAAWKELRARGTGGPVTLNRGEFSFSVRFLGEKWGWTKDRVQRFIIKLKKRDMIKDASRDTCQIYLVNNYNRFQVVGTPKRDSDRDSNRDKDATAPRQQRDKEEEGETGKKVIDLTSFGRAIASACAAAQAQGSEVIRLPTNRYSSKNEEFPLFETHVAEFEHAYPAVDVRAQLRAMRAWLISNTNGRKTSTGMLRFVNSWLGREQNKGNQNGGNRTAGRGEPPNQSFATTVSERVAARARGSLFGDGGPEGFGPDDGGGQILDLRPS